MSYISDELRQAYHNDLTDVPLLIDAAEEIERLAGELRDCDLTISVEQGKVAYRDKLLAAAEARATALAAEVERLKETNQKQYDDGYTHGLGFAKLERKAKGKRLARFVMTGDMAEASKTGETVSAEVERLTYELKR